MNLQTDRLVDSALEKYRLPVWVRPYVYRYVRENPISAVKYAISLVDVKRKKGEITKTQVRLPNGTTFNMASVLKLLNLFFYGEESMARIEEAWATKSLDRNAEYERRFLEISVLDMRRTRALKNLAEGLGHSVGEQPKSLEKAFERISKIDSWHDRVITTGIILRYSYAATFGIIFYKVFYPVSPEFMRSFSKAFEDKGTERWDTEEARRLIAENVVEREHVLKLARGILSNVLWSIEANMKLARELKLEREVRLLSDISIVYPFQVLSEMGLDVDPDRELRGIRKLSSK
ncbi:MAG: hypothetical protein KGI06_04650 [Candidatus Micrarchaeota archaeon]|nr:hypothetical protein [Candidatus Micrarchaeota archaeon]